MLQILLDCIAIMLVIMPVILLEKMSPYDTLFLRTFLLLISISQQVNKYNAQAFSSFKVIYLFISDAKSEYC